MSYHGCKLLALPDELLIEILFQSSLKDVIRLEVTCKRLRLLCHTQLLWLKMLKDLDVECAPDIPPHQSLETISCADLRAKVIDAVQDFQRWKKEEHLRMVQEFELHVQEPENGTELPMCARLLPGGKKVLILNTGRIELWNLEPRSCTWHAPEFLGRHACSFFDFDVVQNGTVVMIVGEFIVPEISTTYLRVFRCNIEGPSPDLVYEVGLPYTNLFRLTIRDNFCTAFLPHRFQTVLIDWKSGKGVFLEFVDSAGNTVNDHVRSPHLYEGHLLALGKLSAGFCLFSSRLCIPEDEWSYEADYRFWASFRHNLEDGHVLFLSPPDEEGNGPWMLETHLFCPTWRTNAPAELFIVAYNNMWYTPKGLLSFRIHLCRSPESQSSSTASLIPVLKSSVHTLAQRLPWDPHCITNSGHAVCLRKRLRLFSLFSEAEQPMTELEVGGLESSGGEPTVTVEPWSHRIVVSLKGTVRVFQLK